MSGRLVAATLTLLLAAPPLLAQDLRGRVTHRWGTDEATRCVPDVEAAFARLPGTGTPLGFHLGQQRPLFRITSHWQGVARLAVGDGRWLVASRSGSDSALAVVHLPSRAALPGRWGANRLGGGGPDRGLPPPSMDRVVHSVSAEAGITHGGGLQAVGPWVVVPFEARGDSARVVVYDFSDPLRPRRAGIVVRTLEAGPLTDASLAALARLDTGQWLLVVGGPSARRLRFLRSRDTVLTGSDLAFDPVGDQLGGVVAGLQALNLVTQCDGRLYALGFHNTAFPPPSMGRDHVHLYALVPEPDGPRLVERGELHVRCVGCNLAGGAGTYVTASGELVFYALGLTEAGPGDTVPLDEFAERAH